MPNLPLMASDANYPSNNGIRVGLTSLVNTGLYPIRLMQVELMVGGTPGTGASYTVQTLTQQGNWVNTPIKLSGDGVAATGVVCGMVEGCSVRVASVNGSGAGTTTSTPRYWLGVTPQYRRDKATG